MARGTLTSETLNARNEHIRCAAHLDWRLDLTAVIFTGKMTVMYTRSLQPPARSYFLLGPRGTGKTTWVSQHYSMAHKFDLLKPSEFLRFSRNPELFRLELNAIEVKSTKEWKSDFGKALKALLNEKSIHRAYGVYLGSRTLRDGQLTASSQPRR